MTTEADLKEKMNHYVREGRIRRKAPLGEPFDIERDDCCMVPELTPALRAKMDVLAKEDEARGYPLDSESVKWGRQIAKGDPDDKKRDS